MKTEPTFSIRSTQVHPSFIRDILKAAGQPHVISLAGGLPESSLFPHQELAKSAYRILMNNGQEALQYTTTEGYAPLRRFIAERYHRQQGLMISPEQVLITSGSQQALDLISKLLIDPGDAIVVERPTYLGAIQCFSQYEPRVLEVNLHEEGPDYGQLIRILNEEHVKLFYTIPNFQNPTGNVHSLDSRIAITSIIKESSAWIIEDDPYGEIRFEGEALSSLHALLPEQTIRLGTFSKTVAPGLRIGWIIATPDVIRRLAVLKQASDLHSSHLDQQVMYDYLTHYDLDQHIERVRQLYRLRRDVMKSALDEYFPLAVRYRIPHGGLFFWIELPEEVDAMDVLKLCIQEGVLFVPGETFYTANPLTNTIRLNFSTTEEEKIKYAIKTIGDIMRSMIEKSPRVKWFSIP